CSLLSTHPQLTALFCFNDLVAVGALQACNELKLRVPQDLAIVGHDDIPVAALVSPALTTCRIPRVELGARAVNALLERLRDCPDDCSQIILQPELIIRESAP
ncbi:MAG: LacI family transcriptional regulator, partial [Chloroflexi bacterium]